MGWARCQGESLGIVVDAQVILSTSGRGGGGVEPETGDGPGRLHILWGHFFFAQAASGDTVWATSLPCEIYGEVSLFPNCVVKCYSVAGFRELNGDFCSTSDYRLSLLL